MHGLRMDRYPFYFDTVESHTCGEPTRVIVGGFPPISGRTMAEKKAYAAEHFDSLRRAVMLEPRGHADMFGAVITEPCTPDADFGILFMDHGGFTDMCGHGTIGAVTVLIETGRAEITGEKTELVLDTPAGVVRAMADTAGGRVGSVSIRNVPSFLYRPEREMLFEGRSVCYSVAYGGAFFALVDVHQFSMTIAPENMDALSALAVRLMDRINRDDFFVHPMNGTSRVDRVEFYEMASDGSLRMKNTVISPERMVDRSPCGTGTSAKLAELYATGKMGLGDHLENRSILDTCFIGRIDGETDLCGYKAILPVISGRAFLTGAATYVLDPDDSVRFGFSL